MKENNKYELIKFKDGEFELDVNVSPNEDTVWLSKDGIALLFDRNRTVIGRHITNIFAELELDEKRNVQKMHVANSDKPVAFYNLDVILAIGFRIKSKRGIIFRRWATSVLKQFVFQKQDCLECKERIIDLQKQIYEIRDFQNKSLTLKETNRVDALFMLEEILKSAKHTLVIVDNYFDHSFDEILLHSPAKVVVITHPKNESFDSDKYEVIKVDKFHDRYLFIDNKAYHFGESFNKLGTDISTCDYMPNFTLENFLEISGIKI